MSIERAIKKINPNAAFIVDGGDINRITWLEGTTPISKSDIEAQYPAVDFDFAMEVLVFPLPLFSEYEIYTKLFL